jgi:hypothetical protein
MRYREGQQVGSLGSTEWASRQRLALMQWWMAVGAVFIF